MPFDPFALDYEDDLFGELEADQDVVSETEEPVKEEKKSVSKAADVGPNEGITVTLKAGSGYEAPWVVIHAKDSASALEQLKQTELRELVDTTAKAANYFHSNYSAPAKGAAASSQRKAVSTPQQKPAAPQSRDTPEPAGRPDPCEHGEWRWQSKISTKGSPYSAWFAPCPQGDKCFDSGIVFPPKGRR